MASSEWKSNPIEKALDVTVGGVMRGLGLAGKPGKSETKLTFASPEEELARKFLLQQILGVLFGSAGPQGGFPQGLSPQGGGMPQAGGFSQAPPPTFPGFGGVAGGFGGMRPPGPTPQVVPQGPQLQPMGVSGQFSQGFAPRQGTLEPIPGMNPLAQFAGMSQFRRPM